LDLDPSNNPTSHHGACHSEYNLALNTSKVFELQSDEILCLRIRRWFKKEMFMS